jgi:hypothetical protein
MVWKWQRNHHWSRVDCDWNGHDGKWRMVYWKGEGVRLFTGGKSPYGVIAGVP